jgi:hypothetical protein
LSATDDTRETDFSLISTAADVAAALGHATVASYIRQHRADGWTWNAIAAECGQPPTWLRRQAVSA